MTTVIGTCELERDMVWDDEFFDSEVNASVTDTLAGGIVVQEFQATEKGRPITLISAEGFGYQPRSTVLELQALAAVAGATYEFKIFPYTGDTFRRMVRFRNEISGGDVQFKPVQAREGIPRTTMYYEGAIYLMVVGDLEATTTTSTTTSTSTSTSTSTTV